MKRADIVAFAARDWKSVQGTNERYWVERTPSLTPEEALEIADGLRRHVKSLRPDWPSAEDRERDLEVHARVSEALRSVHLPNRRLISWRGWVASSLCEGLAGTSSAPRPWSSGEPHG